MDRTVAKFVIGDAPTRNYYIQIGWHAKEYKVDMTDGKFVWSGEGGVVRALCAHVTLRSAVSQASVDSYCRQFKLTVDTYLKRARDALSTQDERQFRYEFKPPPTDGPGEGMVSLQDVCVSACLDTAIQLIWKMKVENAWLKNLIVMRRVERVSVVQDIFDFLISRAGILDVCKHVGTTGIEVSTG
jgi:hypothetical protein